MSAPHIEDLWVGSLEELRDFAVRVGPTPHETPEGLRLFCGVGRHVKAHGLALLVHRHPKGLQAVEFLPECDCEPEAASAYWEALRRELAPDAGAPTGAGPGGGRRAELTPASEIQSERVRWLWKGRAPLRGITVVPGEKGLGKSILTNAWLPAKLTRGELEGELYGTPVDVLVASAEDDWRAVVKPRLEAHGADLERVHCLRVRDDVGEMLLTLPDDVSLVEDAIERQRHRGRTVAAVVIDPISAFLGDSIDSHKDASVRRAIAPVAAMADRQNLAVVIVAHLTKDESRRLISRVSGSGAFVNAARSVLGYARDPGDPDGEQGRNRVLAHVASNWGAYAPSLGITIESREVDLDDGSRGDVGYLQVTGEVDVGIEDLQRVDLDGLAADDREQEIAAALADGPRPSRDVKASVAAELGCSRKTVQRAAMAMRDRGELSVTESGWPRTTTWALGAHTASADASVGTRPDAPGVPTVRTRIPEPHPADGGDSGDGGDTPPAREPEPNCTCPRPARSPRADGPDQCHVCKKPMAVQEAA